MDQHSKHVLCYLDLDQFRKFNDGGGQAAGDAFLRQIASLLRAKVRGRDSVARLGGDDFGILLEHCPMDKAMRIASKLRQSIQEFQMRWDGDTYHLTASVGVTPISTMGQSASSLLSAAEATCYIAKTVGGNRVKVHRPEDQELQQYSQTRWVERINQALEENGFRLFYQPIVPVPGRAVGDRTPHYELLLRMVDETGKLRSAGSFLPFAERYNMIQVTDRWVVRTAFEWLATGGYSAKDLIIALNVSEPTVSDPDFAEYVKQQLNQTEISADCICFQIAARTAHARPNVAASFIQGLIGMGFRTAIDNLGTGLWSADQLAGLQVDYLKIESTHIEDITTSSLNQAIVKSVTEIARVLGMKTIAKAVENDATLEALQRIGVDYAQGYGVARPKPLDFLKKTR
jgi:diguanylate cyclase (GGDEF)-like protein